MEIPDEIRIMPKVELHEHLDGGLRPQTIVELAHRDGVRLPSDDPSVLSAILSPGPSSLEVYLRAFGVTVSVMQTAESLRRVAFEQVEDWHRDGVVYGEVRFAPELHTQKGLGMEEIVEAVLDGLDDGRKAFPVDTGLILCSMRHAPPSLATAQLVNRYRTDGVVGFDLAGAELPFRPGLHRQAFEFCADRYLATTCHAGEVTGPDYIREALEACRALRIGHGTQLVQEWADRQTVPGQGTLTRWILDRKIPLEMCLSSNLQTRACPDLPAHPFGTFRRAGLAAVICTDNRLVSGTTLSKELALAADTWGLSVDDLQGVQLTALEAGFCSSETKDRIRAKYFPGIVR